MQTEELLFFWSMIWSVCFFNEKISIQNIIGVMIIFVGVFIVNKGKEENQNG